MGGLPARSLQRQRADSSGRPTASDLTVRQESRAAAGSSARASRCRFATRTGARARGVESEGPGCYKSRRSGPPKPSHPRCERLVTARHVDDAQPPRAQGDPAAWILVRPFVIGTAVSLRSIHVRTAPPESPDVDSHIPHTVTRYAQESRASRECALSRGIEVQISTDSSPQLPTAASPRGADFPPLVSQ